MENKCRHSPPPYPDRGGGRGRRAIRHFFANPKLSASISVERWLGLGRVGLGRAKIERSRELSKSAENKKTYLRLADDGELIFFCWRAVSPLLEKRIRNHRKQFRKCDLNIAGPRILRTEVLVLRVPNRWLPRERGRLPQN